jgi:hypothetical protein
VIKILVGDQILKNLGVELKLILKKEWAFLFSGAALDI